MLSRVQGDERRPAPAKPGLAGRLIIGVVRAYQMTLSPLLGAACRFEPSCSAYCVEAVRKHGGGRGMVMGLRRVLRCHPFHPGGYDPVP